MHNTDIAKIEYTLNNPYTNDLLLGTNFETKSPKQDFHNKPVGYTDVKELYFKDLYIGLLYYSQNSNRIRLHFEQDLFVKSGFDFVAFDNELNLFLQSPSQSVVYLEVYKMSNKPYIYNQMFEIYCNFYSKIGQKIESKYEFNSKSPKTIHSLYLNTQFIIAKIDSDLNKVLKNHQHLVIYKKTNSTPYEKAYFANNGLDLTKDIFRFEVRLKSYSLRNLERKGYQINFLNLFNPDLQAEILNLFMTEGLTFKDLSKPYYDKNRNKKFQVFCLWEKIEAKPVEKIETKPSIPKSRKTNNTPLKRLILDYYENPNQNTFELIIRDIKNYNSKYLNVLNDLSPYLGYTFTENLFNQIVTILNPEYEYQENPF